jgi:hypothetical protein
MNSITLSLESAAAAVVKRAARRAGLPTSSLCVQGAKVNWLVARFTGAQVEFYEFLDRQAGRSRCCPKLECPERVGINPTNYQPSSWVLAGFYLPGT